MALMSMIKGASDSGGGGTVGSGLVPLMSSTSSGGVTLSSSGTYYQFYVYLAFNRSQATNYAVLDTAAERYIEIDFDTAKTVNAIVIGNAYNTVSRDNGEFYDGVTIKGYNGSSWETIGNGNSSSNEINAQTLFPLKSGSYTKIKVIFDSNHGGTYLSVGEIQVFGS